MVIFSKFSPMSSHLYPLQVENCGSNSRLVVDEDDNGKIRLERVNIHNIMAIAAKRFEEYDYTHTSLFDSYDC